MDALSAPERARFERHLTGCEECAQEVAGLHETTARLAAATALAPPVALKQRVMAAAAITRQHAPDTGPAPARGGGWRGRPAWPGRLVTAAAAAVVLVVGGIAVTFGISNGSMHDQLSRAQDSSRQIAAVLTAQDATMMTGTVRGGGSVTVVASRSRAALVFSATGLHGLPGFARLRTVADRPGRGPAGGHAARGPPGHDRPRRCVRAAAGRPSCSYCRTHGRYQPSHRPDDDRPYRVTVHPGRSRSSGR